MNSEFKEKVNTFFKTIRKAGYFAKQNLEDCGSCAVAVIPEGITKFVYYHSQDKRRADNGGSLMIGYGGNGIEVATAAQKAGLKVNWNGDDKQRIELLQI